MDRGALLGTSGLCLLLTTVLALLMDVHGQTVDTVTTLLTSSDDESEPLQADVNTVYPLHVDPGGGTAGKERHFNAVGSGVWLSRCRSNSSEVWKMTGPVCSTRFTSFVLFVLVTVVLSVITLWTVLGNTLVLCALYRYRSLRTMSNCLIGNLAVSDLLLAITVLPISATYDLLGYWVFGSTMCTVWLSIDVLYCTASIWGLCTIAFDRYTATVYPMWYHDKRSTSKALAYMLFVWVFSIVISLAPFIGWQDMISGFYIYDPSINRYKCVLFSSKSYVIYSAIGSFVLPSCFMTFLYVKIFVVLHKQSDHLKRSSLTSDKASPLVNGCPTIAVSSIQDTSCAVLRDLTASTFITEETTMVRGEVEEVEEEEEEEEGDKADSISPTRSECDPADSRVDRNSNTSVISSKQGKESSGLLRDQRSNSLNVEMETFRTGGKLLSQPKSDFLAVSTSNIPLQFSMKKSRSAAFNLQDSGSHRPGSGSNPPVPSTVPRSKSVSILTGSHMEELEVSHSASSILSLQRFTLPWPNRRRNQMTTSMKRRFQLREQRATKRMLLIMACFFVCWVPFTLMYMLRSLCPHCKPLDDHVTAVIIWMGYVNSSLNPLLYTLFNDDFRKAFKKLLRIPCPGSPDITGR